MTTLNLFLKISAMLKVPPQPALAYLLLDRFVVMLFQSNNGHYRSLSLDSIGVLGDSIFHKTGSNTIFKAFLSKHA